MRVDLMFLVIALFSGQAGAGAEECPRPGVPEHIILEEDHTAFVQTIRVRAKDGSHLGVVKADGMFASRKSWYGMNGEELASYSLMRTSGEAGESPLMPMFPTEYIDPVDCQGNTIGRVELSYVAHYCLVTVHNVGGKIVGKSTGQNASDHQIDVVDETSGKHILSIERKNPVLGSITWEATFKDGANSSLAGDPRIVVLALAQQFRETSRGLNLILLLLILPLLCCCACCCMYFQRGINSGNSYVDPGFWGTPYHHQQYQYRSMP
mmetsp:Transcript_34869/g.54504  ORF Transcript_34869/g.54504 Transcript_34869/m.54504 type:complete len:266 (+) Transcript_34869:209-1006(+)|eukprot:CAMPEP_0184309510 /NCGR_PEP_ID=MMETSP1049-20130417/17645_1 /TAXON_ID=77928 /ORGANISM="Proteomonas sulcata, Strain CCMP704" /LENGTH=265 /DNA_ID=CAMNT_0026622399 /DNA_START=425 /DNA_END=1222 /DNA_ORIENTATION=+